MVRTSRSSHWRGPAIAGWRRRASLANLGSGQCNAFLGASAVASPRTIYKEEHELFRRSVKAFIDREIAPHYERWEKEGQVSREVWRKAGDAGLLLTDMPEAYGGADAHFAATAATAE